MKRIWIGLMFFIIMLAFNACAGNSQKIIFRPEAESSQMPDEAASESWRLVDSQNGPAGTADWLVNFLEGGIQKVEKTSPFQNSYVFIAENRGANFSALSQWAQQFTAVQDMPRLVALRIERRLLADAELYPDDEYGDFFESLIKAASDAVYSGAQKRETFWIKRRIISENENSAESETEDNNINNEDYCFYVLLSVNKLLLQTEIKSLMSEIKNGVSPTRSQSAAINRIQQNFFEGF